MSNQSIVEHKANMHYVEFREDYLAICLKCSYKKLVKGKDKSKASPYCKALILAISEGWTNDKRGKGTDLSFYMTYPQWIESMYGMFGRNVVIDSIDELIGEKLLSRDPVKYRGKDTFRYTLNHAELNQRMKKLDDRDPNTTHPQVNGLISKRDEKSTGLQVNGKAFTNQRDTRLQVNDDPFTKGRNIESTYHPYVDSAQNTEGTYSAPESTTTSGADAPTLENTEYHPDLSSEQVTAKEIAPAVEQAIEHVDELRRASGALQDAGPSAELSTSSVSCPQPRAKVEEKPVRATRSKKTTEPAIEFTPEGRKVYEAWCANFKSAPRAGDKTIDCANALYERLVPWCKELHLPCKELLNDIKNFLFATATNGFYKRGVTLCDIERDFEKWQSAKTYELEQTARKAEPSKTATNPLIEQLRAQHQRFAQSERPRS